MKSSWLRVGLVSVCFLVCHAARSADTSLPLIVKEDFEHGMGRWKTSDPGGAKSVWKIIEVGEPGNHALRCTGKSKYAPKFRSPLSYALLKDVNVTDFELMAHVQETHLNA